MRKQLLYILMALATVQVWHGREQAAAQVIDREYEIKAALLYKFGTLFKWPNGDAGEPFVIGILGKDPFGRHLAEVQRRKTIGGRRIKIVQFDSIDDYQTCQILFIPTAPARDGSTAPQRLVKAVQVVRRSPVLIVSESQGLPALGAGLAIFIKDNRVRLEVNPEAVRREGLAVPATVLRLATVVRDR